MAILMIMIVIGILGISIYGLIWPWMVALSPWGQLMDKYTKSLDKIDVARGRCVPMPSDMVNSSRFSLATSLPMFSRPDFSKTKFPKTSLERLVDALNPYTASPNIRLILDMVAYR